MSDEKRTIKGLLLELRLTTHFEGKISCEEEILQMFEDLEANLAIATEALDKVDEISFNNGYHSVSGISRQALAEIKGGE